MAAFASLCIQSNPSTTVSRRIYSNKSLKSSIPSFNKQKIKTRRQREKKYRPVRMSIWLEEGEKQGGGGAGLLERGEIVFPKIATPLPEVDTASGGDIGKSEENWGTGGGERYKVLLLDHERHTEKQVAAVLPKVVPSITAEEAKKCFHESRKTGESLVTVAVKEHAEFYAQMMARCGLRSAIEPDSDVL